MSTITRNEALLIASFIAQYFINFIDEYKLQNHPLLRQKTKNTLKNFAEALEEQINLFVKGTTTTPASKLGNEEIDELHNGTLAIGEFFDMQFAISQMSEEVQESFIRDYNALIEKYKIVSIEETLSN